MIVRIVDYGIGNLFSVARAFEHVGVSAELTGDPDAIMASDCVVLPGVGAFEPCSKSLRQAGLVEPVLAFARSGRPFLGICVGMQLLFDYSLEFGRHPGLSLVPGHVEPIPVINYTGGLRKVPHVGWGELLLPPARNSWSDTVLADLVPGHSSAYFVHSFSGSPAREVDRLADVNYQGYRICAAVQVDNVVGFQCHPEKSGEVGLTILKKFIGRCVP